MKTPSPIINVAYNKRDNEQPSTLHVLLALPLQRMKNGAKSANEKEKHNTNRMHV